MYHVTTNRNKNNNGNSNLTALDIGICKDTCKHQAFIVARAAAASAFANASSNLTPTLDQPKKTTSIQNKTSSKEVAPPSKISKDFMQRN